MRADVVVVGLGTMGAAAALELAGRGARVIGLDRFSPPHERGAHSGGSRIIRMAYMEGPAYVPLVQQAYRRWGELEESTGIELLRPTGGLMLGRPDSVAFGGALATARAENLPHELLDPGQIRRRFPAFTPADDEQGLYEEVAGLIRPEAAITTMLQEARRLGADLRTGTPALSWGYADGHYVVTTPEGPLEADGLVLAPGAWAAELMRYSIPLRVERRVQHYWWPADPTIFAPGRFPIWIWGTAPGEAGYGLPSVGGGGDSGVKAAMHHGGEVVDPHLGAAAARPEEVAEMREWLHRRLPALAQAQWLGGKPCLYALTPDEHFILGEHPWYGYVAVACGFSGHGFKFAPVVGEILADIAQGKPVRHDISLFDPARFDRAGQTSTIGA